LNGQIRLSRVIQLIEAAMRKQFLLLIGFWFVGVAGAAPSCEVKSGPMTAALLELYTSEGCSSCPPADRRLGQFPDREFTADKLVPIALHVDYWDYIGWRDPYAQPAFAERQHWLVTTNRESTVYTPHFFISGRELGGWHSDLAQETRRINHQPARANLTLRVGKGKPGMLSVDVQASSAERTAPLGLFIAITENRLVSEVRAGENKGETLTHDHVVREWIGPIALANGALSAQRDVALGAAWNRTEIGAVGFVQNTATGEILQAVSAEHCGTGATP
jgi:hypothetical protein